MATILKFRRPEHKWAGEDTARATVQHHKRRSAEIIIFPGVRIERQEEPERPTVAPTTGKRAGRTARRKP